MDSEAAVMVVTLSGVTVSVAVDAAKGSVVVTLTTEDGEPVTLDSEKDEGLREALEQAKADYIDLAAKYQRMDEGWKATLQKDWAVFEKHESQWNADRKKLHDDRMSMARRFIDANQRAYQAERRVRELEAKVECLEQDLLKATA